MVPYVTDEVQVLSSSIGTYIAWPKNLIEIEEPSEMRLSSHQKNTKASKAKMEKIQEKKATETFAKRKGNQMIKDAECRKVDLKHIINSAFFNLKYQGKAHYVQLRKVHPRWIDVKDKQVEGGYFVMRMMYDIMVRATLPYLEKGNGENIRSTCINALASISKWIDWKAYYGLLLRCFHKMTLQPDKQKMLMRLICSILDRFHFSEANFVCEIKGSTENIPNPGTSKEPSKLPATFPKFVDPYKIHSS
ncbi:hypothetical protein DM860_014950 [Cuscuta australis]|uniref:Uncharacterized protein n=1 Tax=Cuscuta australis TaxID=267555 RepID=A0A328E6N4_9ASTE|nr:hypothetical protein DM860_014950 [Cuscuta australis]